MEHNLYIEPHFLHKELCFSVLPREGQQKLFNYIKAFLQSPLAHNKMMQAVTYADFLTEHLVENNLPSLEQKVITKSLREGDMVWTLQTFQFSGTYAAARAFDDGQDPSYAKLYSINPVLEEAKVTAKFNIKHTNTSSSVEMLSGKSKKYILGYVKNIGKSEIELRPIIIGNCYYKNRSFPVPIQSNLMIQPDEIAEFSAIKKSFYCRFLRMLTHHSCLC